MPVPENALFDKNVNKTCPPSSTYFPVGVRVSLSRITSHLGLSSSFNNSIILVPLDKPKLRTFFAYTMRSGTTFVVFACIPCETGETGETGET